MARGRPRKPANQAKIDGTRVKRTPLVEIFVPDGAPFIPPHLHDDAQLCAEQIIEVFSTVKHLSKLDSYLLSVFASAWAWHKQAMEAMNDPDFEPIVVSPKTGAEKASPWFAIAAQQANIMLAISPKLYLSPADRMTLNIGRQGDQPKSKFDGLLGRRGKPPANHTALPAPDADDADEADSASRH